MTFQKRAWNWAVCCFGTRYSIDKRERNHRFLEESLELVQSLGCTKEEALILVDYVYSRPVGEPSQESGGVMLTLAVLCEANELDMKRNGEVELLRVNEPKIFEKIRNKQALKPRNSPLPEEVTK